MKINYSKLKILSRIILLFIPIFILVWLINKQIAPLGRLEIKYNLKNPSPFISKPYPNERISSLAKEDGKYYREIIDDIIYFNFELPRSSYQKAKVKIKFKNENQPIFDLGALTSKEKWTFDTYTLENKIIDQSEWNKIQEGDLVLLQKERKFNSIDEFLKSISAKTKIAFYNYNKLPKIVEIDNYKKSDKILELNHALMGSHTFYTYIDNNELLDFTFDYIDINREKGGDPFKINVVKEDSGQLIFQENVKDDGTAVPSGNISEDKNFVLKIPGLEKGVYKINLDIDKDLIIKKIKTKQNLILFEKTLYLAENPEYLPEITEKMLLIEFYNTGSNLYIQAEGKEGLQNIKINDQEYEINEIGRKFDFNQENGLKSEGLNKISSAKSNLFIESDGYFAFSPENYFDPKPKNIAQINENLDINKFDYIIAKYDPDNLVEKNGWEEAIIEFDINKLYINKEKNITFMFSSPGLKSNNYKIKLSAINIDLEKEPFTLDKIWTKLKSYK